MAVLDIKNVSIQYHDKTIVSGASLKIEKGEWFSLVGESGGGKSILSSAVGGLLPTDMNVFDGEINFLGKNIANLSSKALRKIRGKNIAYIFQDYQGSFTPFIPVGKQMDQMIKHHEVMTRAERKKLILTSLTDVGLEAKRIIKSYPFQLSGGQLQRAVIAQAMMLRPELLIADEPTTALDSITTVQILKLLNAVKKDYQCAIFFITHDLRCVKHYSDSIAIINKGVIVEAGKKREVMKNPRHGYTKNLFNSVPPMHNCPHRLPVNDQSSKKCKWKGCLTNE